MLRFEVARQDVENISENISVDEKIYQITSQLMEGKENWDIHDIQEQDDKYVITVKETVKQIEEIVVEQQEDNSDNVLGPDIFLPEKSIAYEGPWEDERFELDITQAVALFETVQCCEYAMQAAQIIQNSQNLDECKNLSARIINAVALRSLQECKRFILENLTEYEPSDYENITSEDPNKPMEVKIKEEFLNHLQKWEEESIDIYQKMAQQIQQKSKIVTATMIPKDGFNPQGPG